MAARATTILDTPGGRGVDTMVEAEPFCVKDNDDVVTHLTKLFEIGALFSNKNLIRGYYVVKLFPFSLKDDAKILV